MRQEKSQILVILHSLTLTFNNDYVIWLWEPHDIYTIKSLFFFVLVVLQLRFLSWFSL
jgi:hypothetical protein